MYNQQTSPLDIYLHILTLSSFLCWYFTKTQDFIDRDYFVTNVNR